MKKYYFETKNYYFYINFSCVLKKSVKWLYKVIFTAMAIYGAVILFEIAVLLGFKILRI